ncbi:7-carboxy-7-deazaguanine synthase QueE [Cytophagales bacterium LB-30]|uniref:7-carboxy-7-deazaguanine synthase n=1 Tax=Shiella aurantiaca TaxID=3058365 RepID=A0ABT8F652_9BACT|nr:7-carboxy-7-deazaguanine synthase QueE [Shiella aurantiaca]MDN4165943.1 7-carboxy-7-deazaguanine synthase QueE [Shiella aurantiaca]
MQKTTLQEAPVESYPIMEAFYTLQGEGYYQGHAAYFIRLGGCDVGCVWCDVKDSWEAERWPVQTVSQIVEEAVQFPGRLAVITGGEPAMYNLQALTAQLHARGFKTNIETSGVYPLTGAWDWVCFSPKKFKAPHESVYAQANELKVVIYHPSDLAWAESHAAKVSGACKLYLQPEWSKHQQMLPLIIDYIKANPKWEISLQIHKFMDIP